MIEMSNKKSLDNDVNEARTEGEGFLPGFVNKQCGTGRHSATARRKSSKEYNKMAILCYLQATEGPNIGYSKGMHQYWKDYGLLEM